MVFLSSIGTALPPHRADNAAISEASIQWLEDPQQRALFLRFLSSSLTRARHFICSPTELLTLGGAKQRAEIFEREAPALAARAVDAALKGANLTPQDIDALLFTSCSCPLIPAPDTYLFDRMGFRRDIVRIPSYQFGCAGGVIGLGLALRLGASLKNILLLSTEICSLVFHAENRLASDLVGAAIFGDGAGAAILQSTPQGAGLHLLSHQSYLLPETRHLMGYDIEDTGAHLRLDKELPSHLVRVAPALVDEFLAKHGLSRTDVKWWLFHPGGVKILSFLHDAFGLNASQACWASDVLTSVGNLSSATIAFVIKSFLQDRVAARGDRALIMGIGPGLTVELVLAECYQE